MELSLSNLCFMGVDTFMMRDLAPEYGVEIFSECGNDYYWNHELPRIMEGRKGPLSVHAPFLNMNLCDPDQDMEPVLETFRWTYDLCNRFGAKHCTCHPHSKMLADKSRLEEGRKLCVDRLFTLNEMANKQGIHLLIENMPHEECILEQDDFLRVLAPVSEFRFLIDTGHALLKKWDFPYVLSVLGSRIEGYHINDNDGVGDIHLKAWEGILDWDMFFDAYVRYTPDASLVCEYKTGPLEECERSMEKIRRHITAAREKLEAGKA